MRSKFGWAVLRPLGHPFRSFFGDPFYQMNSTVTHSWDEIFHERCKDTFAELNKQLVWSDFASDSCSMFFLASNEVKFTNKAMPTMRDLFRHQNPHFEIHNLFAGMFGWLSNTNLCLWQFTSWDWRVKLRGHERPLSIARNLTWRQRDSASDSCSVFVCGALSNPENETGLCFQCGTSCAISL